MGQFAKLFQNGSSQAVRLPRQFRFKGDKVRIRDGAVYLNGVKLDESYVPSWYLDGRSYPETVMGPHTFFLMGDHRNMSSDSREFGPVDQSYIFGKAVFVYWPMERMGRLK